MLFLYRNMAVVMSREIDLKGSQHKQQKQKPKGLFLKISENFSILQLTRQEKKVDRNRRQPEVGGGWYQSFPVAHNLYPVILVLILPTFKCKPIFSSN